MILLGSLLPNARYIAAKEFRGSVRSKSFAIGTIIVAVIAFSATQIPVLMDFAASTSQTRLAIVLPATGVSPNTVALVDTALNGGANVEQPAFAISWFPGGDPAAVQADLEAGKYDALLLVRRDASSPDLAFVLKTDQPTDGGSVRAIGSMLFRLETEDRAYRSGTSTDALFADFAYSIEPVRPGASRPNSLSQEVSGNLLSTGLIVLIFMAIITYGTWVAMSVAEEKGSRVMELMLNAATPAQMLAGKVIGKGAAGLAQYGLIIGAVVAGLLAQGPIHKAVVGTDTGEPFGGLNPVVLAAFMVLFLLGFLLYSLLYAAMGSLVSRQEDVQTATSPLMTLVMSGYFISIFGLQASNEAWVRILSLVPFFSPYLMLGRVSMGTVEPWEFALAVVLLVASIVVATFLAARIYSAGVLLYGQRVGLREVLRAARVSR
jgi:ABC-2 type transport system permease protein